MTAPHIVCLSCLLVVCTYSTAVGQPSRQLDDYLNQGLQRSPLLYDLSNQVRSIRIDSARVRANYRPQVNVNASNAYAPIVNGWGYDEAISNGTTLSDLVTINQRLISQRNLESQLDSVSIQAAGVRNDMIVNERDLRNKITDQYISAYGSWQAYTYNEELLHLLREQDRILKSLAQSGVYKQTDYLSLLVTLKQQEIATRESNLQFRDDLSKLNEFCGITDTTGVALSAPELGPPPSLQATATVFYHKFTIDSLKLQNADRRIDFQYKPRLGLYADAGYVSSLILTPYRNFGTSIGMTVTFPIYDGHQRRMQHEQVRISENTRSRYADFFKSKYRQHVAELRRQLQVVERVINDSRNQLQYVDGLIDANRRLLQTGDIPVTNYIISINSYLSAHHSIIQNEMRRLRVLNEINYWK